MSLSTFEKWEILEKLSVESGLGEIFTCSHATAHYDVDFMGLQYLKDYETHLGVSLDSGGAQPHAEVHFTPKGIKRLLKRNRKMIEEVERLFREFIEDGARYEKV